MVHADIGEKTNKITSLCGLKSGQYVMQSLDLIGFDGQLSAEVTCERCKTTAQFYGRGRSLTESRAIARRQAAV